MRETGSNVIHKSDNDFNKEVLGLIALAKLTDPRGFIDCLTGGKPIEELRNEKEKQRIDERKKDGEER